MLLVANVFGGRCATMADEESFQREAFSGTYLTMLGIIQAAAFTLLLTETLAYVQEAYIDVGSAQPLDLFVQSLADLRLWRAFATLAAVIIVTLEFTYFVRVQYRAVSVSDILTLYFMGIAEFCVVSQIPIATNWWITNILYSIAGACVYWNSSTYNFEDLFKGDQRRILLTKWHYVRARAVAITGAFFALFVAYSMLTANMPYVHELVFSMIWLFGFGTIVFWNASDYITEISRPAGLSPPHARS